jgi:hypothetical protein
MGGLPRLVAIFLTQSKKHYEQNKPINEWPWIDIMNAVSHEAEKRYFNGIRKLPIARTLLVDAVLERRVDRSDVVLGSSETYGQLEESGKVILNRPRGAEPGKPSKPFVGLPLILLNTTQQRSIR